MKLLALVFILGMAFGASHPEQVQDSKAKIQKDLEDGYENLKAQIKELQGKINTASGDVKKDMQDQMANLEKDQKELQSKIEKMKHSSGEAWDDVKVGASSAYDSLKKSIHKAKARFQEEKNETQKAEKK